MPSQSLIQISEFLEYYPIEFVQELPDRLKCVICKNVLRNAKQTSCGCKVCENCINNYLKDGKKPCPSKQPECSDTMLMLASDIHQDNATNREISNLKIKCPSRSCEAIDTIRSILNDMGVCEHREINCDKCSSKYPHKEKADHDNNMCDQRIVSCEHCSKKMTAADLEQTHLNVDVEDLCSEYRGDCPNECGLQNVLLKIHLQACINQRVEGPFKYPQCEAGKMTKIRLNNHLEDECVAHNNTLVATLVRLKIENKQLTEKVEQLKKMLVEQMSVTGKLTESRIKSDRAIEELKKKGPGGASVEKNIVFRNGNYIWKISDFEVLKADAESGGKASVTSDPFYTSEFGYKMCLRIYPAGDGVGRGTHLSVFFAIMRGDYDDLLSWPFKQKVTLSLLDQENGGNQNYSRKIKPGVRSACYQKPTDDCNIAEGSPQFIALASLIPSSIYCRGDTIFLKISVDTILRNISRP